MGVTIIIIELCMMSLSIYLHFKVLSTQLDNILSAIKIYTDICDKNEKILNLLLIDYTSKKREKTDNAKKV